MKDNKELLIFSMLVIYNMEVDRVKKLYNISDIDIINILKKYENCSISDETYKNVILY